MKLGDEPFLGLTFLFRTTGDVREHLHIVVTEPSDDCQEVMTLMLLSKKDFLCDYTELVPHGDQHPFVKHSSVVDYAKPRKIQISRLSDEIDNGRAELLDGRFPDDDFQRILNGITNSGATPLEWVQYYVERNRKASSP